MEVRLHDAQNVAFVYVPLVGGSDLDLAGASLDKLRDEVRPATLGKVDGVEAPITGQVAGSKDFNDQLAGAVVPVFAFVVVFAFLLMLLSFRSLTIALTSIVLNLLSVGAAYGVLVAMFQHGWGASLVGAEGVGAIITWLPLFLFVILFGLSMDYHVFVVSRIREARLRGLATKDAIRHGVVTTAGVVTSAAVIMVAVFAIFGTLSMQSMKQMGVGLAAAVLIDATIIRGVLLPHGDGAARRAQLVPAEVAAPAAGPHPRRVAAGGCRGIGGTGRRGRARQGLIPAVARRAPLVSGEPTGPSQFVSRARRGATARRGTASGPDERAVRPR